MMSSSDSPRRIVLPCVALLVALIGTGGATASAATAPAAAPAAVVSVPAPAPSPTASPAPKRDGLHAYLASDALLDTAVSNELAPGVSGSASFDVKGMVEIPFGSTRWMVGGDLRQFAYTHPADLGFLACPSSSTPCSTIIGGPTYRGGACPRPDPGCVTVIGHDAYQAALGAGQAYVPSFDAHDGDVDARVGIAVAPHVYLAASYLWRTFDYLGYPTQSGVGFGLEKVPDFAKRLSLYGSVYYYPSVSGTYTGPTSPYLGTLSGATFTWQYRVVKYEVGVSYAVHGSPVFVEGGFLGDGGSGKENAPSNYTHTAIALGAGVHL